MLSNTTNFASLDAALPNLIEKRSLSGVNVTENAHDRLPNRHVNYPILSSINDNAVPQ